MLSNVYIPILKRLPKQSLTLFGDSYSNPVLLLSTSVRGPIDGVRKSTGKPHDSLVKKTYQLNDGMLEDKIEYRTLEPYFGSSTASEGSKREKYLRHARHVSYLMYEESIRGSILRQIDKSRKVDNILGGKFLRMYLITTKVVNMIVTEKNYHYY